MSYQCILKFELVFSTFCSEHLGDDDHTAHPCLSIAVATLQQLAMSIHPYPGGCKPCRQFCVSLLP